MDSRSSFGQLFRLANLYRVQTAFYGVRHRRYTATAESLLAVLKALGAPVASLADVPAAYREKVQSRWHQVMEPVTVVRRGGHPVIDITLPSGAVGAASIARLELESGGVFEWQFRARDLPVSESAEVEGRRYTVYRMKLPKQLPCGYHRFILPIKGQARETLIITAPRRAFSPPGVKNERVWGAFLPLYALKTAHDWGAGDYAGLGAFADWVAGEGGRVVGTLPLLPAFLDNPLEPSPYAPVSRLLWNEFYVDVTGAPEWVRCPTARAMVQSFAGEIEGLRRLSRVDYRRVTSLKRRVMEEIVYRQSDWSEVRCGEFRRFARNPLVEDYARFRAAMEKQHAVWRGWPPRLRDGNLGTGDYDENVKNYYLYAQWLAQQQVRELAEKARRKRLSLYFDLPVGVHPDGYDVWRHRDIFVENISAGAPPDPVFTGGQDWGFPPLHPEKIRAQGYGYVRDYLRHHLRYAAMLRIDHIMGLHRLYWVPRGFPATAGMYVRYRPEELYAILALESCRHRSVIVGEDLGIVPGYIRPAMARYGLHRLYILYYELADNASRTPRHLPHHCVASLNTHDMFPFAAFWKGGDIKENAALGLLDAKEARAETANRRAANEALAAFLQDGGFLGKSLRHARAVLKACLGFLSGSRARTVLVNLEDLWLETRAQNVPGTGDKFPSWRRKARYALEEFCRLKDVGDILKEVDKKRK